MKKVIIILIISLLMTNCTGLLNSLRRNKTSKVEITRGGKISSTPVDSQVRLGMIFDEAKKIIYREYAGLSKERAFVRGHNAIKIIVSSDESFLFIFTKHNDQLYIIKKTFVHRRQGFPQARLDNLLMKYGLPSKTKKNGNYHSSYIEYIWEKPNIIISMFYTSNHIGRIQTIDRKLTKIERKK